MTSEVPTSTRVAGRLSDLNDLTPLTETTAASDPQAAYQRLRDQWGTVAPVQLEPGVNAWRVLGYDEICQVLKHERLFCHDPHHWRLMTFQQVAGLPHDSVMRSIQLVGDLIPEFDAV